MLPTDLDPALCLGLGRRPWGFQKAEVHHTIEPAGGFRTNAGALLIDAAVAGGGLVQLPAYYGVAERARGDLVTVLDDWVDPRQRFEFFIVYPPQRHLPRRVRALIDVLVDGVSPVGADA